MQTLGPKHVNPNLYYFLPKEFFLVILCRHKLQKKKYGFLILIFDLGGYVVDDPRVGYYSTSTLPSAAQLRKSSGYQMVPVQQGPPGSRAISEPRAAKQKLVAATSTLDRYTLMAANQARAKSADRAQMKYRRVSLDPTYHQGYPGTF